MSIKAINIPIAVNLCSVDEISTNKLLFDLALQLSTVI